MNRRGVIVLLLGANLFLLATLIILNAPPPEAFAQAAPLGQNYVMVTARIRQDMDGLYVLDLSQRRLHLFMPNRDTMNRRAVYLGYRDLQKDFRGGR
jgi:hypothetical protein